MTPHPITKHGNSNPDRSGYQYGSNQNVPLVEDKPPLWKRLIGLEQ